ncbi:MAG TPA: hypothetical protein VGE97_03450 [Nitrososphaera sp.]|jgi:hypothetical protein
MPVVPYPAGANQKGDVIPTSDALPITKRVDKAAGVAWEKGDPVFKNFTNKNFEKVAGGAKPGSVAAENAAAADTKGVIFVSNIEVICQLGGPVPKGSRVKGGAAAGKLDAFVEGTDTSDKDFGTALYHPNTTPMETTGNATDGVLDELYVIKLAQAEKCG